MLSRKDLNSALLETVKACKSPKTVVTADCEVLTKEATVYVRELDLFVTEFFHSEHFAKITGIPTIGLVVKKTTTPQRWQTNLMQHGELGTDRSS